MKVIQLERIHVALDLISLLHGTQINNTHFASIVHHDVRRLQIEVEEVISMEVRNDSHEFEEKFVFVRYRLVDRVLANVFVAAVLHDAEVLIFQHLLSHFVFLFDLIVNLVVSEVINQTTNALDLLRHFVVGDTIVHLNC